MINNVWLYTFTQPNITVSQAALDLSISENTARTHLNKLVSLEMTDTDSSRTRNKVHVNYDLLQILR